MPRPYSTDLRERAVEAVESGASRREIAEIFKVGVSSVIRWCQRWSETGSAAPKRSGGSVSPLEEHSDWILALIAKQPDLTLEEILAAMAKQGIPGSRSALLTGAVMSERKQADHCAAGLLLGLLGQQRLECTDISTAREQLIAIDQMEQRHRFLAQRMDDVMVVDDVAVLTAPLRRPTTPQGQELRGAEEAL